MAGRALTITYLADARSVLAAQGQMDAGHSKLDDSTKRTGGVFSTTFGSLMPIAAAAAGAAVIKFGADSVKAAIEAEQAMALTNAVIESTGGVANVTAEDVVGLANRLRDLSGVDDEVIQSSSNLLLTFKNVRNEVGAGNDVFDQAQLSILDMATALNNGAIPSLEDLNGATKLVGKALNDPVSGLSKLTRAGVDFTEQQKEQIRTLVESGDVMGAQKIVLGELETEFGGAAKAAGDTFAGAVAKLKNEVEDLQETVGVFAIETLTNLGQGIVQIGGFLNVTGPSLEEAANQSAELIRQWQNGAITATQLQEGLQGISNASGDTITVTDELAASIAAGTIAEAQKERGLRPLRGATDDLAAAEGEAAEATDEATDASKAHEEAMREERLATLSLSDSFLGIIGEAKNLREEQRELNRLQRQGKEDTRAYDDQLLEVLESQLSLEDAIVSYGSELVEAGKKQKDVERELRDAGRQAGLTRGEVNELIDRVRELIRAGEDYDGSTYKATFTGYFDPEGVPGRAMQHGGIVTRPTVALIGEAGPEAVIPLSRAGGLGGNVTVNVYVEGSVTAERDLAETIRAEFIRVGQRNGSALGGWA